MSMNKKWIVLICIVILIIIAIIVSSIFEKQKEKDRDYNLLEVTEYKYYVLCVNGKYGVIKRDGTVIIDPNYDEVQIPNQDREIFILTKDTEHRVMNEKNEIIFADVSDVSAISGEDSAGQKNFNNTVLKYRENDKYGLLSFDGQKLTEALYDEMSSLDDKYGEILIKKDNKYLI